MTTALPTRHAVDTSNDSAASIANDWFQSFKQCIENENFDSKLFLEDSLWRDTLSVTSDFRTVQGANNIQNIFGNRLKAVRVSQLQLASDALRLPVIRKPFPDLTLLQICFDFETSIGKGSAICHLAPTETEGWKAYAMFTCLDSLKEFPEKAGKFRETTGCSHSTLPSSDCKHDINFEESDPVCLIIGAGHSGLETAARLKALGVPTLVVEKQPHVGDNWRKRYRSLSLHDTVWYNQLPYMNFPTTWPVYSPGSKIGDFLESYAKTLELSVWTGTDINQATWNQQDKNWTVNVTRQKVQRVLRPKHLIFATGFGLPMMPDVAGKKEFSGEIVHSSSYTSASNYSPSCKKAIVIGAANSAHDIALDLCRQGVDVTMHQRSSTYVVSAKAVAAMLGAFYFDGCNTDFADRLSMSFTTPVTKLIHQRVVPGLAKTLDKEILEGLAAVGFKTNLGYDNAGVMQLLLRRAGGYYVDTGASKKIIDGSIKVKSGSPIERFDQNGLVFEDGSRISADLVVFATGFGDPREVAAEICGPDVTNRLKPVWGLNEEGELNSAWRNSGHDRLWFALGNFALSRFYSSALALQIKAIEENITLAAHV